MGSRLSPHLSSFPTDQGEHRRTAIALSLARVRGRSLGSRTELLVARRKDCGSEVEWAGTVALEHTDRSLGIGGRHTGCRHNLDMPYGTAGVVASAVDRPDLADR